MTLRKDDDVTVTADDRPITKTVDIGNGMGDNGNDGGLMTEGRADGDDGVMATGGRRFGMTAAITKADDDDDGKTVTTEADGPDNGKPR